MNPRTVLLIILVTGKIKKKSLWNASDLRWTRREFRGNLAPMFRVPLIASILVAALTLPLSAAPKFSVVRISDIYRNLTSTHTLLSGLQKEREEILKDERGMQVRKSLTELQEMQKNLQQRLKNREAGSPLDDETRKLAQEFELKRQQAQSLQEEFQVFERERQKELNRKMVTSMRSSLDKITVTARRIAAEQGYDGVFDSSGHSNTGVPLIIYSKSAKDLTDEVIAALADAGDPSRSPGEEAAPAPPEPPTEAPPEAPASVEAPNP